MNIDDMTIEQLVAEETGLLGQIAPLQRRLAQVRKELEEKRSRAFILHCNITLKDVFVPELSMHTIHQFIDWLKLQPLARRFCEWNGRLYFTSDLLGWGMKKTDGLFEHVPKE